jgi:hypothetical protein
LKVLPQSIITSILLRKNCRNKSTSEKSVPKIFAELIDNETFHWNNLNMPEMTWTLMEAASPAHSHAVDPFTGE